MAKSLWSRLLFSDNIMSLIANRLCRPIEFYDLMDVWSGCSHGNFFNYELYTTFTYFIKHVQEYL